MCFNYYNFANFQRITTFDNTSLLTSLATVTIPLDQFPETFSCPRLPAALLFLPLFWCLGWASEIWTLEVCSLKRPNSVSFQSSLASWLPDSQPLASSIVGFARLSSAWPSCELFAPTWPAQLDRNSWMPCAARPFHWLGTRRAWAWLLGCPSYRYPVA